MRAFTPIETEMILDFHWSMLALIKENRRYLSSINNLLCCDLTTSDAFQIWNEIASKSHNAIQKIKKDFSIKNDEHLRALIEAITSLEEQSSFSDDTPDDLLNPECTEKIQLSIRKKESGWGFLHKIAFYSPELLQLIFLIAKQSTRLQTKIAHLIHHNKNIYWTFQDEMALFAPNQVQHFQSLIQSSQIMSEAIKADNASKKNDDHHLFYSGLYFILHELPKEIALAKINSSGRASIAAQLISLKYEHWTIVQIWARYAHHHLITLFELAAMSPIIEKALSETIPVQNQEGWALLHMMTYFRPHLLSPLLDLASNKNQIKLSIIHALPLQNDAGDTIMHMLPRFTSEPFIGYFKEFKLIQNTSHLWTAFNLANNSSQPDQLSKLMDFAKAHPEMQEKMADTLSIRNIKGRTCIHEIAIHIPQRLPLFFEIASRCTPFLKVMTSTLTMQDETGYSWLPLIATCGIQDVYKNLFLLCDNNLNFQGALIKAMMHNCNGVNALTTMGQYSLEHLSLFFFYVKKNQLHEAEIANALPFNTKADWPILHLMTRYMPKLVDNFLGELNKGDRQLAFFEALSIQNTFNVNAFQIIAKNSPAILNNLFHLAKTNQTLLASIEKGNVVRSVISLTPQLFPALLSLIKKSTCLQRELASLLSIQDAKNSFIFHMIIYRYTSEVPELFAIADTNQYMRQMIADTLIKTDNEKDSALLKLLEYLPDPSLPWLFNCSYFDTSIKKALTTAFPIKNEAGLSAISVLANKVIMYLPNFFDFIGRIKLNEIDPALKNEYVSYAASLGDKLASYFSANQSEPELSFLTDKTTLLGALIDEYDKSRLVAKANSILPTRLTLFFNTTILPSMGTYFNSLRAQLDKSQEQYKEIILKTNTNPNNFEYWRQIILTHPDQLSEHFSNDLFSEKLGIKNASGTTVLQAIICLAENQLASIFGLAKVNPRFQKILFSTLFIANSRNHNAFSLICHRAEKQLSHFYDFLGNVIANNVDQSIKRILIQYRAILTDTLIQYLDAIKKSSTLDQITNQNTLLGWLIDQITYNQESLRSLVNKHTHTQKEILDAFHRAPNHGVFLRRIAKDCPEGLSILFSFFKEGQYTQTEENLATHLNFKPEKSATLLNRVIQYCPKNLDMVFEMCSTDIHVFDAIMEALSSQEGPATLLKMVDHALQQLPPLLTIAENNDALFTSIMRGLLPASEERPCFMRMIIKHCKKRIPGLITNARDNNQLKKLIAHALPIKDDGGTTGLHEMTATFPDILNDLFKIIENHPDLMQHVINALYITDQHGQSTISILLSNQEKYRQVIYGLFRIFGKMEGSIVNGSTKDALFSDKLNLKEKLKEFLQLNLKNSELPSMINPTRLLGLLIDYQRGILLDHHGHTGTRQFLSSLLAQQNLANDPKTEVDNDPKNMDDFEMI